MSFIYTRDGARKLIGPLGERRRKLAQLLKIGGNEKPIMTACLKWATLVGNENVLSASCFKWLQHGKER